ISRNSVHLNTREQCSTCHVFRKDAVEGISPTVSGHTFEVNFEGCSECHGTIEIAFAKYDGLKFELALRKDNLKTALDAWSSRYGLNWEYTNQGGPDSAGQARIPDAIKKARYLFYYVAGGGGTGVHNPDFVRDCLITAEEYAVNAPAPSP